MLKTFIANNISLDFLQNSSFRNTSNNLVESRDNTYSNSDAQKIQVEAWNNIFDSLYAEIDSPLLPMDMESVIGSHDTSIERATNEEIYFEIFGDVKSRRSHRSTMDELAEIKPEKKALLQDICYRESPKRLGEFNTIMEGISPIDKDCCEQLAAILYDDEKSIDSALRAGGNVDGILLLGTIFLLNAGIALPLKFYNMFDVLLEKGVDINPTNLSTVHPLEMSALGDITTAVDDYFISFKDPKVWVDYAAKFLEINSWSEFISAHEDPLGGFEKRALSLSKNDKLVDKLVSGAAALQTDKGEDWDRFIKYFNGCKNREYMELCLTKETEALLLTILPEDSEFQDLRNKMGQRQDDVSKARISEFVALKSTLAEEGLTEYEQRMTLAASMGFSSKKRDTSTYLAVILPEGEIRNKIVGYYNADNPDYKLDEEKIRSLRGDNKESPGRSPSLTEAEIVSADKKTECRS